VSSAPPSLRPHRRTGRLIPATVLESDSETETPELSPNSVDSTASETSASSQTWEPRTPESGEAIERLIRYFLRKSLPVPWGRQFRGLQIPSSLQYFEWRARRAVSSPRTASAITPSTTITRALPTTSDPHINSLLKGIRLPIISANRTFRRTHSSPAMDNYINYFLEQGVLQSTTEKPYNAYPIFLIPKPDGTSRPVYDLSAITPLLPKKKFSFPNLRKYLSRFPKGQQFCRLDFVQAFLHLPLDAQSSRNLGVIYRKTYYQFTRLPFGHSHGPFYCQKVYSRILRDLFHQPFLWLDDALIPSTTEVDPSIFTPFGVQVNANKSILSPVSSFQVLGLLVDTWKQTISLTESKFCKLMLLYQLLPELTTITENIFLSIKGYLLYIGQVLLLPIYPLNIARTTAELQAGLRVLIFFLRMRPTTSYILPKPTSEAYVDATPNQVGIAIPNSNGFDTQAIPLTSTFPIAMAEYLALTAFILLHGKRDSSIKVWTDNLNVLHSWSRRKAKTALLGIPLLALNVICFQLRLTLVLQYVRSADNPADGPSRTPLF